MKKALLILVLILAFSATAQAQPPLPTGATVKVFRDTTEKVTFIPVNTVSAGPFMKVYHLSLDLLPTDIVMLFGQFEVTNDTGQDVGVGRYIQRDENFRVNPAVMDNVDPIRHHLAPVLYAIDDSHGGGLHDYRLIVYAATTHAKPTDKLRLEQGYGHLIAVVISQ